MSGASSVIDLSLGQLGLALLLVGVVVMVSLRQGLGLERDLLVGSVRTIVQLYLVGLILAFVGAIQLQQFGGPENVLIRLAQQPGGEQAQQDALGKVRGALGESVEYRRVEVVGPRVSGELLSYGTIGIKCWIYRGMYGEEVLETDVRPGGPMRRGRR